MSRKSYNWSDIIFYSLTTALYVLFLYLIGRNLTEPVLWYDEAGQVFLAHGLNHWSAPMSPDGSVWDALVNNHDYNLDPGGYTLLLYLWCKVSSYHVWLRLLSYLFFIATIPVICNISYRVLHNKKLAYASGLMLFALMNGPIGCSIAHEVRSYSIELCGFVYSVWLILVFRKPKSNLAILLSSLALCFFISMRYTMLLIGGITTVFVLYAFYTQYRHNEIDWKQLVRKSVIFAGPLLNVVFLIWRYQMCIQNQGMQSLPWLEYVVSGKLLLYFLILSLVTIITLKWQNYEGKRLIYIYI